MDSHCDIKYFQYIQIKDAKDLYFYVQRRCNCKVSKLSKYPL